ncbi:MAG: Chromosome partition protein Smc [Chroococcopsis gigantea SAG 12.99]|jgi:chromosome segregation protein|nr:Chromosome partition protein Smc [Chroococcopsis gigantea SAG 12.99]
MVYIKRVELTHFKSFGGSTAIPLLPGFTVVSGPNGSGKSNILDALLFCLGLASSKGMRAERLPDLVNTSHNQHRQVTEASVSVTFDLSDVPELSSSTDWTVTRKLKVSKGGNYTSSYFINNEACTVTQLHEELNRLRIYPEGYNVVLQGDVTRIITMNPKERRQIIDELAGVAEFDRKIDKAKETLDSVKEREEKCQIITGELQKNLERLAVDRLKAEKYQKLKATLAQRQRWETVIEWRSLNQQAQSLQSAIEEGQKQIGVIEGEIETIGGEIRDTEKQVLSLNQQVKALGEDEHLSLSSDLATQKSKRQQLEQRQIQIRSSNQTYATSIEQLEQEIRYNERTLESIVAGIQYLTTQKLPAVEKEYKVARLDLETAREDANSIADASEAWIEEQTNLTREINALQNKLNPYASEKAQLQERYDRLQSSISEQNQRLEAIETDIIQKDTIVYGISQQIQNTRPVIQQLSQKLATYEQNRIIATDTQKRLLKEQRDKQRELDKLEATRQATQEAQGTQATGLILQSDLPGVCGLVAQLGEVETQYQLALEIAAGARLGNIVVEDDAVAAAGIALLKQKRAGRGTFLPLSKIRAPRLQDISSLKYALGYIDLALNLVKYNPRYQNIFAYVFGSTVVFNNLEEARSHLGNYRIVTLDGELLEATGAMTGGSINTRNSLHFGKTTNKDSREAEIIKDRLTEIEQVLNRNEQQLHQYERLIANLTQELTGVRQSYREWELKLDQLQKELEKLNAGREDLKQQIGSQEKALETANNRLQVIVVEIPGLESALQREREKLSQLENNQTHSRWQELQAILRSKEAVLQTREISLRQVRESISEQENQQLRLEDKIQLSQQSIYNYGQNLANNGQEIQQLDGEIESVNRSIQDLETSLNRLNQKLGETKKHRDEAEERLKTLQNRQQQKLWQKEKLSNTIAEQQSTVAGLQIQIRSREGEITDMVDVPEIDLEKLQTEIKQLQKKIDALEPVNMLALEEYETNKERLDELSKKLETLEAERTEILLRVENFTTLRLRAFKEAFDAVNENFQSIFATLSDGDGYLQLDNKDNPFEGGLNLVAHPKGKPVQRLSSMSGGEKSLTALSFIFSLQRYRPSPFYAFDEVDMFLDGANVEKLSKMIKQQARQAQFIVVSLRRPMIEASQQTIGVTQARGAYTQVLGIKGID